MQDRPYFQTMDQICRSNGWILGSDKGEMVLGIPQGDGQVSVVVNEFQDATGQLALRLWSPVAAKDKVPPDQALLVNFQLPHGCMAEKDGQIVITVTRIWNFTSQADLTNVLSNVSYYAHFYGQHFSQH